MEEPMFTPSLNSQREQFVIDFVIKNKPKKVADLGCGKCRLMKKLKFQRVIELLVGVDLNGTRIKKKRHGLDPLSTDYLQPTYDQLHVELYQGSITEKDARLRGFDLMTSIEVIEHLTLPDVELFSSVLFGYMRPMNVIISTPNSEFNQLFPGHTGFRHPDHKFEWDRAEFRSWSLKMCSDYGYEVEFTGVGEPPQDKQESIGFCSQIGVFHRLEGSSDSELPGRDMEEVFPYTLVYSVTYPTLHDDNTLHKVLVSEVLYSAEQMKKKWVAEKTGRTKDVLPQGQTEQGGLEGLPSESQKQTGVKQECAKLRWTTDPQEQESGTLNRYVLVPLAALWSSYPKVVQLSGSLTNLKHLLMDQPQVKLSQDGSALLVKYEEQDPERVDSGLKDEEDPLAGQSSHRAEPDWQGNI